MLLDLLVPTRCLGCRDPGPVPFCPDCADELDPDGTIHPLGDGIATVGAFAYAHPLSTAIKATKSGGLRQAADALARLLALPPDVPVTWVPAPRSRRRRRGIDLPERLAGPNAVRLLERVGRPVEQPDLDARQRLEAQVDTFRTTRRLHGPVVLIDDVRATGATLLAAASTLRDAGADRVLGVTLAAAGGPPSAGRRPRRTAGRRGPGSTAASGPTSSRPHG